MSIECPFIFMCLNSFFTTLINGVKLFNTYLTLSKYITLSNLKPYKYRMSSVKDGPNIFIRQETHRELSIEKARLEVKSFDEAIKSLLARPDFTRDELEAIIESIDFYHDCGTGDRDHILYMVLEKLEIKK